MIRIKYVLPLVISALIIVGCAVSGVNSGPCQKVASINFPDAEITDIKSVSAGKEFSLVGLLFGKPFFDVPASCRVSLRHYPTPESDIKSEVWFPQQGWNRKFLGVGNGGFAGSVDTTSLNFALQKNYAVASTDTGHDSSDKEGDWALNQPEKIRDYGYRAIHEMTVKAKTIIESYYGKPPSYSYFSSCSNGGRAGLMEAQRFPHDYDGIVAGAPASNASGMLPVWGWMQQQMLDRSDAWISDDQVDLIADAVLQACDADDGVIDGVINNPPECDFKPEVLLCKQGAKKDCLTAVQVQSLEAIYSGPSGNSEGRPNRGFEPGGELGRGAWKEWITGDEPGNSLQNIYVTEFYRYLIANDKNWDREKFSFNKDQALARKAFKESFDALDPDLSEFQAKGGKLILYHGWSDAAVPPRFTIDYYRAVRDKLGAERADAFARLYMVPGMQHCFGGPGANSFGIFPPAGNASADKNVNAALERWVEKGIAPSAITATKYRGNEFKALLTPENAEPMFSRKLCPYPMVGQWSGNGSQDDAANYSCVPTKQ